MCQIRQLKHYSQHFVNSTIFVNFHNITVQFLCHEFFRRQKQTDALTIQKHCSFE